MPSGAVRWHPLTVVKKVRLMRYGLYTPPVTLMT